MTAQSTLNEISKRLAAIKDRLAETQGLYGHGGSLPAEHAEKASALDAKAKTVEAKLPEGEGSTWDAIAGEVERDVHALEQDFDHWVGYLDKHFADLRKKG